MTKELSNELYRRIYIAVHEQWDPIGVSAYVDDEYRGYIPKIYNLVEQGASSDDIFDYLWSLETVILGLSGNRNATSNFSKWLSELKVEPVSKNT
ncbi:MAG: hypothetical protein AAGB12_05230 [Pseudomonadota bacterium]